MGNITTVLFLASLVLISLFGIGDPKTSVQWLLAASNTFDIIRFTIVGLVIGFWYVLNVEDQTLRRVANSIGIFAIAILMGSWFLPQMYLNNGIHLLALDVMTFIVTAIFSLLSVMYLRDEGVPRHIDKTLPRPTA